MFHLSGGFSFEGHEDGSVTIHYEGSFTGWKSDYGVAEITVPENEWASVVATVSKRGEDYKTWMEAREYHMKERIDGS